MDACVYSNESSGTKKWQCIFDQLSSQGFKVYRLANIHIVVFWVMRQSSLVGDYHCLGGAYCSLKMKAACFSETLAITFQAALSHNSEDHDMNCQGTWLHGILVY
jgi:hypothetical protein